MVSQKYVFAVFFCFCIIFQISTSSDDEKDEGQKLIQDNYEKWTKLYLGWLTEAQKTELKEMIKEGDTLDDFHSTVMEMYFTVKGDPLWKVNEALNRACLTFIDYLTHPSKQHVIEFEKIARTAFDPYTADENKIFAEKTKKRLEEQADLVIAHVKDLKKKKLARKFLPSCVKIFLSAGHMVRYYNNHNEREKYLVKDSDIDNWAKLYLNWLSETEKRNLKALKEEGASLHELRNAIGDYYVTATDKRLTQATKSLYEGCSAFVVYLMGTENAEGFIGFMEEAATERQKVSPKPHAEDKHKFNADERAYEEKLHKRTNELLDNMGNGFKQDLARNFLGSCVGVFDSAFRTTSHEAEENHDEL